LLRWKTSSSTLPSLARSEMTRNTDHGIPRASHTAAIAAVSALAFWIGWTMFTAENEELEELEEELAEEMAAER